MLPLHEESRGRWGFISGQVNPRDAADPERMVRQAHELRAVAPNVMVKVPATAAGLKVLRQLTLAGVPTNVTTQFTVSQVMACAKTVREAVEVARAKGVALDRWRSVLTLMPGRFEDLGPLDAQGTSLAGGLTEEERRWAGVAVFRRAWRLLKDGGYPSRLLLCSMRPGPGPDRCLHLEEALGDAMIVSAQPMHLKFVMDRGEAFRFRPAVEEPVPAAVLAKLQRLPYFRAAWEEGALSPQAFDAFPPVVATNRDFSKAVGEMFSFVSRAMGA
jgi:transaldolase